jgi:pimeloyl-ACP methyl ester carboxylesterase
VQEHAGLGRLLRLPLLGRGLAVLIAPFGGGMVQSGIERGFHPDERLIPAGFVAQRKEIWLQPKVTVSLAQELRVHQEQLSALAPRYPGIRRPVSIVVGSQDRPDVVSGARRLAGEIPGARLTVLEGAGHMLQFVRPEPLTALFEQASALR